MYTVYFLSCNFGVPRVSCNWFKLRIFAETSFKCTPGVCVISVLNVLSLGSNFRVPQGTCTRCKLRVLVVANIKCKSRVYVNSVNFSAF